MSVEQDIVKLRKKIEQLLTSSTEPEKNETVAEEATDLLAALAAITDMNEQLLRQTKVAFAVDRLRKSALLDEAGKRAAKDLLKGWQKLPSSSKTDDKGKKKQSTSGNSKTVTANKNADKVERDAPIDFEITCTQPPKRNKHGKNILLLLASHNYHRI